MLGPLPKTQTTKEKLEQALPKENPAPNTSVEPIQSSLPPNGSSTSSPQDSVNSKEEKNAMPAEPSTECVKQCSSCGDSKRKSAFTLTQWKQTTRTGRCIECCEKEASTSEPETSTTKQCFSCHQSKLQSAFTSSQWKQSVGTGRYIGCHVETEEKLSQPSASVDVSASQYVKPCFECHKSKPHVEFTASQWKKRVGTGKCITCVSNTIQWKTGLVCSSLQIKACGECNVSKPHAEFSPNQWRKKTGTGRCKECVKTSLP